MNKAEQYSWVKPGDVGKPCRIKTDKLKFDYAYQRDEVSEIKTLRMARTFSWIAFGYIIVMERPNGALYVVDGGQRLRAAIRREDIESVPCVVFNSDGRQHEARAFLSLNVDRTPVTAVAKFNASVKAAKNPESEIAGWLRLEGMHVTADGKDRFGICFPSNLIQLWVTDPTSSKESIKINRIINGEEPLHSVGYKGVWWLLHSGVNMHDHLKKLMNCGGSSAVLRSVKTIELETGLKASVKTCGLGVLGLINYKLHNKIKISQQE